jgi:putative tricarboxylic transport membrane protein
MTSAKPIRLARTPLFVAFGLAALAGLTIWDASQASVLPSYGVGPTAMPYAVATLLGILALGHLRQAFATDGLAESQQTDLVAVGWVGLGLFGVLAATAAGGGFILGSALLFAFTARAFGRESLVADLAIGLALGVLIFFVFSNLLELTLPEGPLETLF